MRMLSLLAKNTCAHAHWPPSHVDCLPPPAPTGARHITISTVGVPNAIRRMGRLALQSTLAVSIHAPNQVRAHAVWLACCTAPLTRCRDPTLAACASVVALCPRTKRPDISTLQALREEIVPSARAYPLKAFFTNRLTKYSN